MALVSGTNYSPDWFTKPGLFPTGTDIGSGLVAQLAVAKQFGHAKKFAALYCAEIAACASSVAPLKAAAPKLGIQFTSLAVSATATSYTAQCLQLQQQKVDYAQLDFTTAAAAKFIQDCQAQNYNPTWGSSGPAIGSDLQKVSDITVYGPAYNFPSVLDVAPVSTFRDAMAKYAKDDNWAEGSASGTWDGLEMLHKALANARRESDAGRCPGRSLHLQGREPRRPAGQQVDLHQGQAECVRVAALLLRHRHQGRQDGRAKRGDAGVPRRMIEAVDPGVTQPPGPRHPSSAVEARTTHESPQARGSDCACMSTCPSSSPASRRGRSTG